SPAAWPRPAGAAGPPGRSVDGVRVAAPALQQRLGARPRLWLADRGCVFGPAGQRGLGGGQGAFRGLGPGQPFDGDGLGHLGPPPPLVPLAAEPVDLALRRPVLGPSSTILPL